MNKNGPCFVQLQLSCNNVASGLHLENATGCGAGLRQHAEKEKIMSRMLLLVLLVSLFLIVGARAQGEPSLNGGFSPVIEDNSFLIEEAYNQEKGVIQHISTLAYAPLARDFTYVFTEEWPLFQPAHQISVTLPYSFMNSNSVRGFGDALINYRYQLFSKEHWAAVAPRISLIFPSGSMEKGLGLGAPGLQVNLPASKRLSKHWITHLNAGFTVQGAKTHDSGVKKTLTAYNVGASVIWLTSSNYNFLLEYVTNFGSELDEAGRKLRFTDPIISPGFRYALNRGSLQVVPGIGLPISIRSGEPRWGLLFYLSFEHPLSHN